MTIATRASQVDLLRTVYRDQLRIQFNLRSILLQYLQRNTVSDFAQGEQITLKLHTGGNGGMRWSSRGKLAVSGYQKIKRGNFNWTGLYGSIGIDGAHMEGAKASYAAEVRPLELEMRNLVKQIRPALNFDLFGDGSGKLADEIESVTDATSFVVDDIRGFTDGMLIDVLLTASGSVGAGMSQAVISVNRATRTITSVSPDGTSPAVTFADGSGAGVGAALGDYTVYRSGSRNDAVNGLRAIVSEDNPPVANYGGIDRTTPTNEYWQAVVDAPGAPRFIEFGMIDDLRSEIEKRGNGQPNLLITSYEQIRNLKKLLLNQRRYEGTATKLNGWAEAVMYNDLPIVADKHCEPTELFMLDTSKIEIYQNDGGDWIQEDGNILKFVHGEHRYEAHWFQFMQLICEEPNAQGKLENLDPAPLDI